MQTYTKSHPFSGYNQEDGFHVVTGYNAEDVSSHTARTGVLSATESFTGELNPYWRSQIRNGANATTAASGRKYMGSPGYFEIHQRAQGITPAGGVFQTITDDSYGYFTPSNVGTDLNTQPSASVVTSVTNRCIRDFIQKVNEAQTSGNLTGRSIKHFEHDIHSISNPVAGLRSQIQRYLSRLMKVGTVHGHSRNSLLTDIRAAYLELQFGIKPFCEDITDIVKDLSRDRPDTIPVSASASQLYAGSASTINLWTNIGSIISGTVQATYGYKLTGLYQVRYKGAVRTGANPDTGKVSWLQDNNLLPKDWIPTFYHILPYTWMVDYFTNLGDVIDSLAFRWSDLTWGCATTRNTVTCFATDITATSKLPGQLPPNHYVTDCWASGGSSVWSSTSFTRQILTPSSLVPTFEFRIPKSPTDYVNVMFAFLPRIKAVTSFIGSLL